MQTQVFILESDYIVFEISLIMNTNYIEGSVTILIIIWFDKI